MKTFVIASVNISKTKGVEKTPVDSITLVQDHGVLSDAHAEGGIRQVSLLAEEDIGAMKAKGVDVSNGDFAENITTRGIDLPALPIGTRLKIGLCELEVSKIGKECHTGCAIMRKAGDCIMPRRGIFAKVITGGEVSRESSCSYGL